MNNKKSFLLHLDSLQVLDDLTDEMAGQFIKAILHYQLKGELPKLDLVIKIAITPFINQFVRDNEKWDSVRRAKSEAGKKGGRPAKAKKANGFFEKQTKAKKAVSDNVSDNVNDSVNDNKKNLPASPQGASLDYIEPEFLELVKDFIQYRKSELNKPFKTERGIKQFYNNLRMLARDNLQEAKKLIEHAKNNEWLKVYPLDESNSKIDNKKYYNEKNKRNIDW